MPEDRFRYFRIEAAELLERLNEGVLELGRGATSAADIARLFRYAHTLKGASRVVKLIDISEGAHRIEDELTPYREGNRVIPSDCVDRLLAELDAIALAVRAIEPASRPVASSPAPSPAPRRVEPDTSVRVDTADVEQVNLGLGLVFAELARLADRLAELRAIGSQLQAHEALTSTSSGKNLHESATAAADALLRAERGISEQFDRVARELETVTTNAEHLRLLPVTGLFIGLERAVRDSARELGRDVELQTVGADVRLDAHTLEALGGALMHIVRNAITHGIEPAAERLAHGKPAAGHVRVEIVQRGREVQVLCEDDGRGLDLERIRQALQAQGRDADSEQQVIEGLLRGGVSTAPTVTALAGRGVGLDVVREAVGRLGGRLNLEPRRGVGLRIELLIPVSAAALDALTVQAGNATVHLPLRSVVRSRSVRRDEVSQGLVGTTIHEAGVAIPFVSLRELLGGKSTPVGALSSTVIVGGPQGMAAITVERLLGSSTKILRPLPALAAASPLVFGAALDAHSNPELVLDSEALIKEAQRKPAEMARATAPRLPILVVDDSLTTRMLEQSILETAGYKVELASSAEDALVKVRDKTFALFLVDVEMPGIDGFEFVYRTRQDPKTTRTPAVLVSSRCAPEDFARGKEVGAAGYIVKDRFDQREVLALIHRLLED
jgi:two-component system, chemotaxis family, sensor kinase CheA